MNITLSGADYGGLVVQWMIDEAAAAWTFMDLDAFRYRLIDGDTQAIYVGAAPGPGHALADVWVPPPPVEEFVGGE